MHFKEDIKYLLKFEKDIEQFFEESFCDYHHKVIDKKHVLSYLYSDLYKYAEIIEIVLKESKKDNKILDIGIAYGFYDIVLVKKYCYMNTVGLELEQNIPIYGKLLTKYGIRVYAGELSEKPLPFESDEFDFIIFSEIIEHLRILPYIALQEINRILKPGGKLLLTTPNIASLSNILKLILGQNISENILNSNQTTSCFLTDNIAHIREYTMSECTQLLTKSGFEITKSFYSNCWDRPYKLLDDLKTPHSIAKRILYVVTLFLPRYRSNIVILARKI